MHFPSRANAARTLLPLLLAPATMFSMAAESPTDRNQPFGRVQLKSPCGPLGAFSASSTGDPMLGATLWAINEPGRSLELPASASAQIGRYEGACARSRTRARACRAPALPPVAGVVGRAVLPA